METKFNRNIQEHKPSRWRTEWQEKLPVKPVFAGFLVLVLAAILILVGNPTGTYLNSPEMDLIRARGILRIGVDDEVVGLYRDGDGLEKALGEMLGERIFSAADCVEFVPVTRQTAAWRLADGAVDLLLMSKTTMDSKEYAESVQPFYQEACVLMGYAPTDALAEKRIAVLQNTEAHACLREYEQEQEPELIIVPYAAYYDMLVALRAGSVDAVCMTRSAALTHLEEGWFLYPVRIGTVEYHAIALTADKVLTGLVGELVAEWTQNGTMAELYQRYGLSG